MCERAIAAPLYPTVFRTWKETSAVPSHNETNAVGDRIVLLGASNLVRAFPDIVAEVGARFQRPLRIICAKGYGRSYGQTSWFLAKKIPGILQCRLWSELRVEQPRRTFAILADIGNDLAYEAPVDAIHSWVEEALDRLSECGAKCVLNNLPLASIRRVGALRYHVVRSVLFPCCRIGWGEMLSRSERLSQRLDELARSRKTPIFSADSAWFGMDPIHPRRRFRMEIFRRMLDELAPHSRGANVVAMTRAQRRRIARMRPAEHSCFGVRRVVEQPAACPLEEIDVYLY